MNESHRILALLRYLVHCGAVLVLCAYPTSALTILNRGNGAEPKSLDPHFIDLIPESNIVGDLLVGLVTFDAGARPVPGAADRWAISADGKTWTFHIRKHVWSDGTPVLAQDFVFAWQRQNPAPK